MTDKLKHIKCEMVEIVIFPPHTMNRKYNISYITLQGVVDQLPTLYN